MAGNATSLDGKRSRREDGTKAQELPGSGGGGGGGAVNQGVMGQNMIYRCVNLGDV